MLIKCPECNKEISDKAASCPHCGFPLTEKLNKNDCKINGITYDLSEEMDFIRNHDNDMSVIAQLRIKYNLSLAEACTLMDIMRNTNSIPKTFDSNDVFPQYQSHTPKCPKCGSTNIADGTRGFTLTTGFLGSGNFRYVCRNCGKKWKP